MTNKLTLALVATALAGLASPALAQSSDRADGTRTVSAAADATATSDYSARQRYRHMTRRDHYRYRYGARPYRAGAYAAAATAGLAYGAYAAAPGPYGYAPPRRAYWNYYSDTPNATGGGTFGYNQGLDDPNY